MTDLHIEIKTLIINSLNLEDINIEDIRSDEDLFGSDQGLNLDSIDALELGLALKKKFGIIVDGDDPDVKKSFQSVNTLVDFIQKQGVQQ